MSRHLRARTIARLFVPLFCLAIASCGGPAAEADLHAIYAAMQVEEARITHASEARAMGDCAARQSACEDTCDAARVLRDLSARAGEPDARTRAERAARTCEACTAESACAEPSTP